MTSNMASIHDSEEINSWFEKHGNQVFDNWNTDAQHAQAPFWCQSLSPDGIDVPKFLFKNTLTASNLENLEADTINQRVMAGLPMRHILGSSTYLDGLEDSSLGDTYLVRKVRKWLNTISKSTEQSSSRRSPLVVGEQLVRTTFLAIYAYGNEEERVVTIDQHYQRQQNPERVNQRERERSTGDGAESDRS